MLKVVLMSIHSNIQVGCVNGSLLPLPLACRPDILICDEPTTALDVTIQAQIIDLLKSLAKRIPIYNYLYHPRP